MLSGPRFSKRVLVSFVGGVDLDDSEKKIPHILWDLATDVDVVCGGVFMMLYRLRDIRQNLSHRPDFFKSPNRSDENKG